MATIQRVMQRPLFWIAALGVVAAVVGIVLAVVLGTGGGGSGY